MSGWLAGIFPVVFYTVGIFLLALGRKGLPANCSGSVPSLGALGCLESLQDARALRHCFSWGLPSWPYRCRG